MTNNQAAMLSVGDNSQISTRLTEYGFEFVGPSHKGVFLFREPSGAAWLLSEMRGKVAPSRLLLQSLWTPENCSTIRMQNA
jgi:hypothetical protein